MNLSCGELDREGTRMDAKEYTNGTTLGLRCFRLLFHTGVIADCQTPNRRRCSFASVRVLRGPILFLAAALLTASAARAEDPGNFPRGTRVADAYGSYVGSFTGERARIGGGTIGAGYYFLDNVGLNLELSGFHNSQHGPDANITDLEVLLRNHVFHSGRFSLFLDVGLGISYADNKTPYYGTYLNYTPQAGVGATFQLWDNVHLLGGARWWHLSNAATEGPDRNPSINGTQAYLGLMVKW